MRQARPPTHDQRMKHDALSVSGCALRSKDVFRELRKQEETNLAGPALKFPETGSSAQHSEHIGDASGNQGGVVGGMRPRLPAEYLGDLVRRPLSKLSQGDRREVSPVLLIEVRRHVV